MKTNARTLLLSTAAFLLVGCLSGCYTSQSMPTDAYPPGSPGIPVTTDAQSIDDITPGKTLYVQNCSACHGMEGYGDGPASIGFCIPPPDLTRIAERNKGHFPYGEIVAIIEGRRAIDAHGYRQMPVWGDVFQQSAKRAGVEEAQGVADGNLLALASWLERIQTYPIDEN